MEVVCALWLMRIYSEGGWPVSFQDVGLAIDHVRVIATQYHLNTSSVIVAGHSAGGHLALWAAARSKLKPGEELYKSSPIHVRGAVSLAGIPDLQAAINNRICGTLAMTLMGGNNLNVPERFAQGSPKELAPLGVPQIYISGAQDYLVPYQYVANYVTYGRKKGDNIALSRFNETGHFEVVTATKEAGQAAINALKTMALQH